MKNFRTFDLSVEFYHSTQTLKLTGDIGDQLARASRSISLNLAEGRGRRTSKDQLRFFNIALGSLRECQAILTLEQLEETNSYKLADKVGAHLYKLTRNMKERL